MLQHSGTFSLTAVMPIILIHVPLPQVGLCSNHTGSHACSLATNNFLLTEPYLLLEHSGACAPIFGIFMFSLTGIVYA